MSECCTATRESVEELQDEGHMACPLCGQAAVTHSSEAGVQAEETSDKERGVYRKYHVERVNDPAGKHDGCWYFVLDPNHDELAVPALRSYVDAARRKGYTALADDLVASLDDGEVPEGLRSDALPELPYERDAR